jgi:aspartate-semialdehyde dehydrogenase
MSKLRCAVVGATGIAGQQFLVALQQHPWFEVVRLAGSERSAGKTYRQALTSPAGQVGWNVAEPMPPMFADMHVYDGSKLELSDLDVVFTAVESDAAKALEPIYAEALPTISTASAFRYETDVPILIPAVNGEQARLLEQQRKGRGWRGFVTPIPNCTTTGLAITLAPLYRTFGIDRVIMTSMQAVSGAGRSPGVIALDITDNVIPYIPKEEEKVQLEVKKILGTLTGDSITPAALEVSATCTRVGVMDGHFETANVALSRPASLAEVRAALEAFGRELSPQTHPSAPQRWITVHDDPYRPQPRKDRDADRGMTTSVGRLREDKVIGPNGIKLVLLSHNTKMGAAMGAVLVAEDLVRRGYIKSP